MPAKLVPTVRTTYTQAQVVKAFVEGWKKLYNQLPKKESIGVIYAQNALETGLTKAMWNNNIGNVKYKANPKDDESIEYCMLANTWEIINGKKVTFQPPSPVTWFRSFKTLADGVAHHFGFLRNQRYKSSWTAVEAGDPALFAHLLKVAGYYTAAEADYVKLMKYHFNTYMKSKDYENAVKDLTDPEVPIQPPVLVTDVPPVLPPDHKPDNTVPENSSGERQPTTISFWDKFQAGLFDILGKLPWNK